MNPNQSRQLSKTLSYNKNNKKGLGVISGRGLAYYVLVLGRILSTKKKILSNNEVKMTLKEMPWDPFCFSVGLYFPLH